MSNPSVRIIYTVEQSECEDVCIVSIRCHTEFDFDEIDEILTEEGIQKLVEEYECFLKRCFPKDEEE